MKKLSLLVCLIVLFGMVAELWAQNHLLITEFCVRPNTPDWQFVEIYNGTGVTVDLTNYYLTDATFQLDNDYINIVDGTFTPFSFDFLAKFPDGATIEDGEYQVVANDGAAFASAFGFEADYELKYTSSVAQDMVAPGPDYIYSNVSLTDGGEVLVLFYWDGTTDLVQDVDYVLWGDKEEAVDKTGVSKDGPDADTDATSYLPDTPVETQIVVAPDRPHTDGKTATRKNLMEVGETFSGGNGITGHNETSEDLATAFSEADPTPGGPYVAIVNVTFIANTATVPDTLGPNSVVQIRGAGGPLTWDGASPVVMENIGGDYWQATAQFTAGEEVQFKFFTNVHDTVYSGVEWENDGWEGNVSSGNRLLTVGESDTTLPLQFVNGWKSEADQYEAPYTTNDSTFVVWVRVNCQGWEDFNPATQIIGLRGSNNVDWGQTGELSWGTTYPLSQESDHVNSGSQQYSGRFFFSGAIHVPNVYAGNALEFKVVVHNAGADLSEGWENMVYNPNLQNHVEVSGIDTTNYWFWFDNLRPTVVEHVDEVIVTWSADMKGALDNRGFAYGDTLQVRSGYFGTANEVRTKMMRRQGLSTRYTATDTIMSTIGGSLDYQYYIIKHGVEYREIYYNFLYTGETLGEAERRMYEPIEGNTITIEDISESQSDIHRMPQFRNTSILTQDVLVTFTCDVRPAIYQTLAGDTLVDVQGTIDVTHPDSVLAWGVAINGPATGSWGNPIGPDWGSHLMTLENKRMVDDGTHGDAVAGDSIYTIQIQFYKDSLDVVGQEFKFGILGGDNEGGYGNNHIENIDDTNPAFTIESQFGSIDPVFYDAWDFNKHTPKTGVEITGPIALPDKFTLEQNYPNPFNPNTTIEYSLPKAANITLRVYNMIGQEVKTLIDKKQVSGLYQVEWDGTDQNGKAVTTGLYIYRIEAGDFVMTKKMMLMK